MIHGYVNQTSYAQFGFAFEVWISFCLEGVFKFIYFLPANLSVVFSCIFYMIKLLYKSKYLFKIQDLKLFVNFSYSLSYTLKHFCEVSKCSA